MRHRRRLVALFAALAVVLMISRATARMPGKVRWLAVGSVALAAWGLAGLSSRRDF